jgi:PAS domain S-box-containing protein
MGYNKRTAQPFDERDKKPEELNMSYQCPTLRRIESIKIVAIYALFGFIWIYGSDTLLGLMIYDPAIIVKIAVIKGFLFIVFTAVLLYGLMNRFAQQIITERTQTGQALRNKDDTYRSLFENTINGIAHVRMIFQGDIPVDFEYLSTNPAFVTVTGIIDSVIGRKMSEVIPDYCINNPESLQVFGQVALTGVPMRWEHHLCELNRWFSFVIYSTGPLEVIIVIENVTERKKAEEALLEQRLELEEAQLLAKVGSWTYDPVSKESNLSKGVLHLVGLDPEQANMSIEDRQKYIHPDDYPQFKAFLKEAVDYGKPYQMELRINRPDGSDRTIITRCQPVCDGTGKVVKLRGTNQDITERKKADKLLLETMNYARLLLKTAPVGIITFKATGEAISANETAAGIVGTTVENVEKQNFRHLESWKRSGMLEVADRAIMTGVSQHCEIAGETTYGKKRHFVGFFTPFDFDGEQQLMVCVIDVSEQKKIEEERNKLERQLHQSQKMEAIGQLAGGVAHDFNNKLMVIIGNAELVKMDCNGSDMILDCIEEIRLAAEQSRKITYRLLAFSRQQVVSPQVLDVNMVIAETLKSLSRLIGEHISISFDPCDKLWNIRMDPVQLDQVVMNLAINARDAMPDGGSFIIETGNITLDPVSCSSIIDAVPGDHVMISFRDTGTGMDKKTLAHIFEPFFTTKEVGKGTGLGLATIYGIIRQNNGFIDVASNVGYGTEFKVYIPQSSASVTETTDQADTICTGTCSILLVEDEDAVRSVTSRYLQRIGYTVHEAATPGAALDMVGNHSLRIDVVLTDYLMPEMNGKVLMGRIRELRPQLQCIYASGHSTDQVQLSENVNFIQKPYNFLKLSVLLKRVLSSGEE